MEGWSALINETIYSILLLVAPFQDRKLWPRMNIEIFILNIFFVFRDGGWILDNFPENRDQWSAMVDAGIVPDEVLFLSDKTPNFEVIRQR